MPERPSPNAPRRRVGIYERLRGPAGSSPARMIGIAGLRSARWPWARACRWRVPWGGAQLPPLATAGGGGPLLTVGQA